jgi:hypothetical protein
MSHTFLRRPEDSEYASHYRGYVEKAPDVDVLSFLEEQRESLSRLIDVVGEARGDLRYAPGKWSVKELLGHIADTERVFAYRALVFARSDAATLPGFDQDAWARHAPFAGLSLGEVTAEVEAVRRASILQFRGLAPEAWDRAGVANNNRITVRAAAFVIAGHAQHHIDILKSRYLGQ